MLFNTILRILKSYRFSLIKIILFELIYLIKGYKGNNITFSKNKLMTNNIPCPYYFLHKIEKIIRNKDFKIFPLGKIISASFFLFNNEILSEGIFASISNFALLTNSKTGVPVLT